MLNSYPLYWSRFIWKLLKPVSLLRAIVTTVKIASTGFQKIVNINSTSKKPIAHGSLYKTISIPLNYIKDAPLIAGFDLNKIDRAVFKYYITGLEQKGICAFCASPDSRMALLHADFEEVDDIYFFKEHPTVFGVVNTKDGDHCTFCIADGSAKITTGQGVLNRFKGSNSDSVNRVMEETLSKKSISNGFSIFTILSACGIIASRTKSSIKRLWKEGNSFFCINAEGVLLQDRNIDQELINASTIPVGSGLTKKDSTGVVVLGDNGYLFIKQNLKNNVVLSKYPGFYSLYPEFRGLDVISWDVFLHIINKNKCYSYRTNNGVDSISSQRLLEDNIILPSNAFMYTDLRIKIPAGSVRLNDVYSFDSMYIIYNDSKTSNGFVYNSISARQLILSAASEYGVIRLTECQKESGELIGISANGEVFGNNMLCGNYLHGIALVKSGKSFREDAIFKYIQLKPMLIKAGANLVIHVL